MKTGRFQITDMNHLYTLHDDDGKENSREYSRDHGKARLVACVDIVAKHR